MSCPSPSLSGSQYAGKWFALQKKDPEGLFLQDNISAEYTIDDDGTMTASSKGRVTLFGYALGFETSALYLLTGFPVDSAEGVMEMFSAVPHYFHSVTKVLLVRAD